MRRTTDDADISALLRLATKALPIEVCVAFDTRDGIRRVVGVEGNATAISDLEAEIADGGPGGRRSLLKADILTRRPAPKSVLGQLVAILKGGKAALSSEIEIFNDVARLIGGHFALHEDQSLESDPQAHNYVEDAVLALPEPLAIFDAEGRFVLWNSPFETLYSGKGAILTKGMHFKTHLENCLGNGLVVSALGREQQWLQERLARFAAADSSHEHQLSNGKWVRVQDRRLPSGGRIGLRTDITDLVEGQLSFRLLFESNPMPMYLIDRTTLAFIDVNDAATEFYGYTHDEFLHLNVADVFEVSGGDGLPGIFEKFLDPNFGEVPRTHFTSKDEKRVVKVSMRSLEYGGRPIILAAVFDMTRQQQIQDEIRQTRAFLKAVVDHVPAAVFVKDIEEGGRYVLYNRACETLFGRAAESVVGFETSEIFLPEEAERFSSQDRAVMEAGPDGLVEEVEIQVQDRSKLVSIKKVAISDQTAMAPKYVLGVAEDVTEQRLREEMTAHRASHDSLTGLPNRSFFIAGLEEALQIATQHRDQALAVHYVDLDGFKAVNDSRGHATGDRLLQMVADRMRSVLRAGDTVARLGGDEFAVLQRSVHRLEEAKALAIRLVSVLSAPYDIDETPCKIGASIGIAMFPQAGTDHESLLNNADAALYASKRGGRGRFTVWNNIETTR